MLCVNVPKWGRLDREMFGDVTGCVRDTGRCTRVKVAGDVGISFNCRSIYISANHERALPAPRTFGQHGGTWEYIQHPAVTKKQEPGSERVPVSDVSVHGMLFTLCGVVCVCRLLGNPPPLSWGWCGPPCGWSRTRTTPRWSPPWLRRRRAARSGSGAVLRGRGYK